MYVNRDSFAACIAMNWVDSDLEDPIRFPNLCIFFATR